MIYILWPADVIDTSSSPASSTSTTAHPNQCQLVQAVQANKPVLLMFSNAHTSTSVNHFSQQTSDLSSCAVASLVHWRLSLVRSEVPAAPVTSDSASLHPGSHDTRCLDVSVPRYKLSPADTRWAAVLDVVETPAMVNVWSLHRRWTWSSTSPPRTLPPRHKQHTMVWSSTCEICSVSLWFHAGFCVKFGCICSRGYGVRGI